MPTDFGSAADSARWDEITIGSFTRIRVEFAHAGSVAPSEPAALSVTKSPAKTKQKTPAKSKSGKIAKPLPILPIVAAASAFVIILGAIVAILIVSYVDNGASNSVKPTTQVRTDVPIPVRVIDPLGGEDSGRS